MHLAGEARKRRLRVWDRSRAKVGHRVFKRRDAKGWIRSITEAVYPRGGWSRAAYYVMHRLRRLPDPPHRIARGVAAGVFVCFTPFFGFHFVLSAALALLMQGNILAAILSTFFGNPLTFPIIAAICLELGQWMLGTPGVGPLPEVFAEFARASTQLWHNFTALFTTEVAHWDKLGRFFWRVMWPYMVGGIVPGIVCALASYMVALPAVEAYQRRRVARLRERYEARRGAIEAAEAEDRARCAPKPDTH